MMNEYPEARHFYYKRSFERRTEIRRRMFKFYQALENQNVLDKIFMNRKSDLYFQNKQNSEIGSSFWRSEQSNEEEDNYEGSDSEEYQDELANN